MAFITCVNGKVVEFAINPTKELLYFDSHSNPTLYSEVYADPVAYSIVDGILIKDGVPVSINPPCSDCAVLDAVMGDGPVTNDDLRAALRLLISKPGFTRG